MSDNPYALRFDIWQEAKQTLAERFYNNYEVWTNWMNPDFNMIGECPIKEKPNYPTYHLLDL